MAGHRIFKMEMGKIYPAYISKAEKKGRTKDEVDEIITWLTGYEGEALVKVMSDGTSVEDFVSKAPALNPDRDLIKGVVCGVRVEEVEDPTMRELRYLDKLIDELAKGKAMPKILRAPTH